MNESTWFYLSFLLIISVFFKFNRLWSIRNVDLILLLFISPGLLFVREQAAAGYAWLFAASFLLLVRVLFDNSFTRRPHLEQNMNAAGLTFLCAASFAFLMTKVMTEAPPTSTVASVRRANELLQGSSQGTSSAIERGEPAPVGGPGSSIIAAPLVRISNVVAGQELRSGQSSSERELIAARTIAILAHLSVIVGLVLVGRHIFGDTELGIAMATLYMLLPCTAYDVGKVNHVLPAALIVWAVWWYRRPLVAGTLLGLACGTLFFPIFLLPLWASFYGKRGAIRFSVAVTSVTAAMLGGILLATGDVQAFMRQTFGYVEWADLQFRVSEASTGFWSHHESAYRIPVFVAFMVMLVALTIWPRRKNLSHLISHSAAIVIGTQFWYPQQGGVYVLWYLPLLLLVMLRPSLSNQLAPELRPFDWWHGPKAKEQPRPMMVMGNTSSGQLFR